MSTALQGPTGGEWVHVNNAHGRDVPTRCDLCGSLVSESWQWYVGLVSHARVCVACADIDTPTKEATMEGTAGITPEILAEVALAIEGANLDWEEGRATSPDTRDFVLITERILTERIGPEYLWLNDGVEGFGLVNAESVAEAMYELQCDGELQEWAEMAEWLSGMVTVGPDATDYPAGERS